MKVVHAQGTEQVSIDLPALETFLTEQGFSQAYLDATTIILLPYGGDVDVPDETFDELMTWDIDVFIYVKRDDITLNQQLLREIRRSCHENDQSAETEECFENWAIEPLTERAEEDIAQFGNTSCPEFFTIGEAVLL